jgi:hypothetical protein
VSQTNVAWWHNLALKIQAGSDEWRPAQCSPNTTPVRLSAGNALRHFRPQALGTGIVSREASGKLTDELLIRFQAAHLITGDAAACKPRSVIGHRAFLGSSRHLSPLLLGTRSYMTG